MNEKQSTDTHPIGDFTKKFILNYFIGWFLIGIVIGFVSELLAEFLPESLLLVSNFLLTILGFWKISSSAIETSLKEVPVESDHINKIERNIFIFLIILLILNIVFSFISFKVSSDFLGGFKDILIASLISKIVATIIQYTIILWFCKNKLEELLLNKKTNKKLYIVILVISSTLILANSLLTSKDTSTNNNETTSENSTFNQTTDTNPTIENQYSDAEWVEIGCSSGSNVDNKTASLNVSLGHYEKNVIKKYKAVKIICEVYQESTNKLIGSKEAYFENVELKYGYLSFRETIKVDLSKAVGNDFSVNIKAYGIPE